MLLNDSILAEDLKRIASVEYIPWEMLKEKNVFITGATGLIGYSLVSGLLYAGAKKKLSINVFALVRDVAKAKERFKEFVGQDYSLHFIEGDLQSIPNIKEHIDYIIHGGGPTSSKYFADHPVETIRTNLDSAIQLLEFARMKDVESFLFLSSMEVYGNIHKQEKVDENHECFIDTMVPRNSYPEVKRMVEMLCTSYAAQYEVPAKSIRLTQTFGVGVRPNDNRVFAQFIKSAMENKDIVLMTKGGTRRSYLYTADAVTAILTVLLKGKVGEAYNAANESSYCSIKEMAELVANLKIIKDRFNGPVAVNVQICDRVNNFYPPELYMDLDVQKLSKLGWKAEISLEESFSRMIRYCCEK